jgi:hypothetical protein
MYGTTRPPTIIIPTSTFTLDRFQTAGTFCPFFLQRGRGDHSRCSGFHSQKAFEEKLDLRTGGKIDLSLLELIIAGVTPPDVMCNKPKEKQAHIEKFTCLFQPCICQTSISRQRQDARQEVTKRTPPQPETQLPHPAFVHQPDGSRLHPPVGDVMIGLDLVSRRSCGPTPMHAMRHFGHPRFLPP